MIKVGASYISDYKNKGHRIINDSSGLHFFIQFSLNCNIQ